MDTGEIVFEAPAGLNSAAVAEALSDVFFCSASPKQRIRYTFLDTFDWRVYAQGAGLALTSRGKKLSATWIDLNSGRRLGPALLDRQPRFIEDISPAPLRQRLAPALEMRALLPQFEVQSDVERLDLLNRDRKTVVRVELDVEKVSEPYKGKPLEPVTLLKVIPLRGYRKCRKRTIRALSKAFKLRKIEDDLILRRLTRLGRLPEDPSKLRIDLSPDISTDTALKRVLLHLLNTAEVNETGTRTNLDTEFLHDFRVANRRARSVFSQVKRVFPSEVVDRITPEFRWLGEITGPTRDLDVYLLNFDKYRDSLPDVQQAQLEPLRHFFKVHQKLEQEKMATSLGSMRYREFKKDWHAFLETSQPDAATKNATRPAIDVVSGRIWKVYKRVIREGRSIGPDTPAEVLHELRKSGKKLRYLMETFQALYPPVKLKLLIGALKALQGNLGDFQDLEVHSLTLQDFGEQMKVEDHVGEDTLLAIGTLIAGFEKRKRQARRAFSACFGSFDCADNRKLFKEVFVGYSK